MPIIVGIVLLASVVGVMISGVGIWSGSFIRTDRFIVSGATNIQIQSHGLGEQHITYQTSDAPYHWYFIVVRNLAADDWAMPVAYRGGLQTTPEVHWRIWSVGGIYVKDRVALQGDPHVARITVSREIIIPWRRYLPWWG